MFDMNLPLRAMYIKDYKMISLIVEIQDDSLSQPSYFHALPQHVKVYEVHTAPTLPTISKYPKSM